MSMADITQPLPLCIECGDQEAAVTCVTCAEPFCRQVLDLQPPCWQQQHRRGKRTMHKTEQLLGVLMPQPAGSVVGVAAPDSSAETAAQTGKAATHVAAGTAAAVTSQQNPASGSVAADTDTDAPPTKDMAFWAEVPLRLSEKERALLGVLQGMLHISEYTDKVDTTRYYGKEGIIFSELQEAFAGLSGLVIGNDTKLGAQLVSEAFSANAVFFRDLFEVGRRYKVMNPEKMRSTYGKLMYLLQDAIETNMQRKIGMSLHAPLKTVGGLLQDNDCGRMLRDPAFALAIAELAPGGVSADARAAARVALCDKYATAELTRADIERVFLSVADAQAYLAATTLPVRRMLSFLERYFSPTEKPGNERFSLNLRWGHGGAKLDHDHKTQYLFVFQSLTLWVRIMEKMFTMWRCADDDLLNPRAYYHLSNTGQGMHRVQSCPKVSGAMHSILSGVHNEVKRWVGLSVVHLGDRDVPNALVFIDKYTQVPRILGPIVQTLDQLDDMARDPGTLDYFKNVYGSVDNLRMEILTDYFRHGFDGSGDDGGSCVDGRLTSTWNWCSKLEKKRFYHVFMLAGFSGFDGSWRAD